MANPLEVCYNPPASEVLPDNISESKIPGLLMVERPVITDERGDFWEVSRVPDLEVATSTSIRIEQINRSRNLTKGTLRGIHVANWSKLVFVTCGSVFLAVVDLRLNSPTYKKTFTEILGASGRSASVFIPPGFGNSYQSLEDNSVFVYAVTSVWSPGQEVGIRWDDPDLGINWPIKDPILSPKDEVNLSLSEQLALAK